jgi:hypothetical protein
MKRKRKPTLSIFYGEPAYSTGSIGLDKKIEGLPEKIGVVETNKERAVRKLIDYCTKFGINRKLWKIEGLVKVEVPRDYPLESAKTFVKGSGVRFVDET